MCGYRSKKICEAFKASFRHYLEMSAEGDPILINSHSGRDYFSMEENLALIDIATARHSRNQFLYRR